MTEDLLRYDKIVERALRGVVRTALDQVGDHGLPGNHSLYITFDMGHPGVEVAEALRQEYPEEMTIVLEHQFWDLETHEDRFEVTLSFDKIQQRLIVPLAAVTAFADPSVQFGLKFEAIDEFAETGVQALNDQPAGDAAPDQEADKPADESEKVVALDAFRKK